jgi:hypothetical protein
MTSSSSSDESEVVPDELPLSISFTRNFRNLRRSFLPGFIRMRRGLCSTMAGGGKANMGTGGGAINAIMGLT